MLVQILTSPREGPVSWRCSLYRVLRQLPRTMAGMNKSSIGKARWARDKADDLHRQARELEQDRSGDWRAKARRLRGADRLRYEAGRFESMAVRWSSFGKLIPKQ